MLKIEPGAGYTVGSTGIDSVIIADDDTQGLVVMPLTLAVPEGGGAPFTVVLTAQPTADILVTIAKQLDGDPDLNADTNSLTFTAANWNIVQTVTLTAMQDVDVTSGAASFVASSAGLEGHTVTAMETDDDISSAILINGDFESGNLNGWTVTTGGAFPVVQTTTVYEGTFGVAMGDGGPDLGAGNTAAIHQSVTIPNSATSATLTLQYLVEGTDGQQWDWMRVFINDDQIASWWSDTGGWKPFEYDLAPYIGTEVTLTISSGTADTQVPVKYFVDDVSVALELEVPTLTLSAATDTGGDPTASESRVDSGVFMVRQSGAPGGGLVVNFSWDNSTAVYGSDFTLGTDTPGASLSINGAAKTGTLAIPAGQSSARIRVVSADDDVDESDESVVVQIEPGMGYSVGTPGSDTVTIADNDTQGLVVTVPMGLQVPEGGSVPVFVKLNARPTSDVVITIVKQPGSDPDLNTDKTMLKFTSDNWDTVQKVTVSAAEDNDATNGSATFVVSSVGLESGIVPVQEVDNDTPPEVLVFGNKIGILDEDSTPDTSDGTDFGSMAQGQAGPERTFTVRNAGGSTLTLGNVTLPVGYTLTEGLSTSLAPSASDSFTVRLDSATTGTKSGEIRFTTNNGDENLFNFSIMGTVTVLPSVTVAATDSNASESGPGSGRFTISRNAGNTGSLTVNFTVGGSAGLSDYNVSFSGETLGTINKSTGVGTITMPAGLESATIMINPINDTMPEEAESVILTLNSGSGYDLDPARHSATVNIADNDQSTVVESNDVPKVIPDRSTVSSTLAVSGLMGNLSDLNVILNITHNRDSDLDIFLISPTGKTVELITDVGGSADDFDNTTLDDEAATSITVGSAPFTGSFRPEGSLSNFDGINPNGTWTLEIKDDTRRYVGKLNSWSLTLVTVNTVPTKVTVLGLNRLSIGNGNSTPDASDGTDFSSVTQGQAGPERTFKVHNEGGSALTPGGVKLPDGFVFTEGLSSGPATSALDGFTVRRV